MARTTEVMASDQHWVSRSGWEEIVVHTISPMAWCIMVLAHEWVRPRSGGGAARAASICGSDGAFSGPMVGMVKWAEMRSRHVHSILGPRRKWVCSLVS